MSTRSERIMALIEQSGKSYQELEKITGIKKSSLQRYATGVTTKIPLDVIERLSLVFNVSAEYLMGWVEETKNSPHEQALTEGEMQLIELFRLIPKEQQDAFLEMGRVFANTLKKG